MKKSLYNHNKYNIIGVHKMYNHIKTNWLAIVILATLVFSNNGLSATSSMQQEIVLRPGWNAVNINIEPNNNNIESIFSGVPIASVWRWIPKEIGQDFILDPAEGLLNIDGWYGYFPEPRPEAFLSNLYTLSGNTAYLIKLDDTVNHTITIEGQPSLRKNLWRSNSFTFTGLPVENGNEPSFGDYFSGSTAHNGQPIYKLSAAGVWEVVTSPFTEATKSGEAYWIFTQGPSSYNGLLNITLQQGENLEFRTVFTEIDFSISNLSDVTNFITISRVSGNTMPIKFKNTDIETGEVGWPTLPNIKVYELQPGEDVFITFAVDRLNFFEEKMEQIFSIKNEQGVEYFLKASGDTIQPLVLPSRSASGALPDSVPESNAGLWVGSIQVDGVSQAQTAGTEPLPVGKPFILRVLMHVDATGGVKLLKNVVQMWQEGTMTPSIDNPEFLEVDVPGHYVLLTDDSLIPNFTGVTFRSGQSTGIRYSTIAYDFNGLDMEMNGQLAIASTVNVSLLIDSDMPTNPFYHKYHPDHDNLDRQFLNPIQEAFQVTREMEFTFTANNPSYPDVADPPGWGVQEMGGIYKESITGLHKNTIFMQGKFRMRRVAATSVLNQ